MEAEVQSCRRHLLHVCEESVKERQETDDSLRIYNFSALTIGEDEGSVSYKTTVSFTPFISPMYLL